MEQSEHSRDQLGAEVAQLKQILSTVQTDYESKIAEFERRASESADFEAAKFQHLNDELETRTKKIESMHRTMAEVDAQCDKFMVRVFF